MKSLILHKFACKILPLQLCLFSVFLFAVPFQSTTSSALSIGFCGDFPGKHNNTAKFHPFFPPLAYFLGSTSGNPRRIRPVAMMLRHCHWEDQSPPQSGESSTFECLLGCYCCPVSIFAPVFFSAWKRLVKGVGESVGHNTSLSNSSNFQCQHISLGKTGIFWVESRVWYMDGAGMGMFHPKWANDYMKKYAFQVAMIRRGLKKPRWTFPLPCLTSCNAIRIVSLQISKK